MEDKPLKFTTEKKNGFYYILDGNGKTVGLPSKETGKLKAVRYKTIKKAAMMIYKLEEASKVQASTQIEG